MNPQIGLRWGSAVAASMPRAWGEAVTDTLSGLAGHLPLTGVAHLRRNLAKVLPEVPSHTLRAAVRSYGRYYLEIMRLSRCATSDAVGPLRVRGGKHLQASLERGRGAILLSGHIGNWDLAAVGLAQQFGNMTVYVEHLRPESLYEFYRRTRRRHGCEVVDAGRGARVARRTLTANGLVGIVSDRCFGAAAQRVPFGRGEIDVPLGGIRLAAISRAALHTVFCVRVGDGYEILVQPEIDIVDADDAGLTQAAAVFADRLADIVQQHPEQWCLMHPTVHNRRTA